jgi:hypothetical protein
MIFPVIPHPNASQPDESVDLKVAMKLLSGYECERDASQAQRMLLRLAESTDAVIASDAARVVKAGAANKWFTEKTPKQYELERIAEATLTRLARRPSLRRVQVLALVLAGVIAAGLLVLLAAGGGSGDGTPLQLVAIIVFLAVIAVAVGLKKASMR